MALTKKSKFKYWVAPFGFSNRFHAGGCRPATVAATESQRG